MPTSTYKMVLPGAMIQRGFWLYVCKIDTSKGEKLYVGRTGDSSSPNAAAPFARLGQHLQIDGNANAILSYLDDVGVSHEDVIRLEMIACGPLFYEEKSMEEHKRPRDIVAALEKKLADSLCSVGYNVLNKVNSKAKLDESLWAEVRAAFATHFPKLR